MSNKPLEGIRVLEVAMYGFVPSAGAVLAEWGADDSPPLAGLPDEDD